MLLAWVGLAGFDAAAVVAIVVANWTNEMWKTVVSIVNLLESFRFIIRNNKDCLLTVCFLRVGAATPVRWHLILVGSSLAYLDSFPIVVSTDLC